MPVFVTVSRGFWRMSRRVSALKSMWLVAAVLGLGRCVRGLPSGFRIVSFWGWRCVDVEIVVIVGVHEKG